MIPAQRGLGPIFITFLLTEYVGLMRSSCNSLLSFLGIKRYTFLLHRGDLHIKSISQEKPQEKHFRHESPECYSCSLETNIPHIFQKAIPFENSWVSVCFICFLKKENLCHMLVTRFSDSSWRFSQGSQLSLLSSRSTFSWFLSQNPNLFQHMGFPSSPGELLSVFIFPLWLRQNIYFNI